MFLLGGISRIMGNVVSTLMLYVDNVVLFAITLGDAHLKLQTTLEEFCMHTNLSVNSSKIKTMLVK